MTNTLPASDRHIDILMSTYNGERYLEEQIQSVLRQECDGWTLFVRDDGSTDLTCRILRHYAASDPRIRLILDDHGNLGAARSFMCLLSCSVAPYFMCADQDDVWLPHKVSLTLDELRRREIDPEKPLLVHTDLRVVDEELNLVAPSFLKFQRLDPVRFSTFRSQMLQNIVTGCALGGNAALRRMSLVGLEELADGMVMHDWWLALVASCFGSVACIEQATILYRQHANNHLGAKGSGMARYLQILRDWSVVDRVNSLLARVSRQCRLFMEIHGERISLDDRKLLLHIAEAESGWSASHALSCIARGAGFKTADCAFGVVMVLLLNPLLARLRTVPALLLKDQTGDGCPPDDINPLRQRKRDP